MSREKELHGVLSEKCNMGNDPLRELVVTVFVETLEVAEAKARLETFDDIAAFVELRAERARAKVVK